MARAVCRGVDTATFFSNRGEPTDEARETCAGCTVREPCLDYATSEGVHGVWAGTSKAERRQWAEFFEDYDALLCPVTPVAAIAHDQSFGSAIVLRTMQAGRRRRSYMDQFVWVGAVGMAYLPATAAPVGQTRQGLPVGVQIVGPCYGDLTTIDLARRLAVIHGGYRPPPAYV